MEVLNHSLKASSHGKVIETPYRAIMEKDKKGKWIVKIQQEIKGKFHTTPGQWYLQTLLFGYPTNVLHQPSDNASIDFGQSWNIDSGMLYALNEAVKYI